VGGEEGSFACREELHQSAALGAQWDGVKEIKITL